MIGIVISGRNMNESELTDKGAELIGRLKIKVNFSRGRTFKLEGQIDKLILSEILPTSYTGPTFPGYDNALWRCWHLGAVDGLRQNERWRQ